MLFVVITGCSIMTSAPLEGVGARQILIFADRGRVVQKGPKYTDVILEQPLSIGTFLVLFVGLF